MINTVDSKHLKSEKRPSIPLPPKNNQNSK